MASRSRPTSSRWNAARGGGARAGEQGRGFAVGRAKVRSLAPAFGRGGQGDQDAHRRLGREGRGGHPPRWACTGTTMDDVVAQVRRMTDLMGEINASSTEQTIRASCRSTRPWRSIDQGTQQNAALVEQSASRRRKPQAAGRRPAGPQSPRAQDRRHAPGGAPPRREHPSCTPSPAPAPLPGADTRGEKAPALHVESSRQWVSMLARCACRRVRRQTSIGIRTRRTRRERSGPRSTPVCPPPPSRRSLLGTASPRVCASPDWIACGAIAVLTVLVAHSVLDGGIPWRASGRCRALLHHQRLPDHLAAAA